MTVSLTIPPVGQYLTTLLAVKQELLIPSADTSADDFIGTLIQEATDTVHEWAGRPLYRAQWSETLQGNSTDSPYLVLSRYPVATVESLTVSGSAITDYVIEKERGLLRRTTGNWADLWSSWSVSTWTVVYTAGYFVTDDDFVNASISADTTDDSYNSATSLFHAHLKAGDVILGASFSDAGNNGLKIVSSATTAKLVVTSNLTTAVAETATLFLRTLPGWIERACIDLVKLQYHRRDRDPGISSLTVGPASVTWAAQGAGDPMAHIERRVRSLAMGG